MLFWSKNKFLLIFLFLVIGLPFIVNKYSKNFFFQEASSISSGNSPCLELNPPTIWVEKDAQSRRGYAPSGAKNTEIISASFLNCGSVTLTGFSFVVESGEIEQILNNSNFGLSFLGSDFVGFISQIDDDSLLVNFIFENPVDITSVKTIQEIRFFGTLPNEYSGKTTFYLNSVNLVDGGSSKIEINRVKSTLVFVKKQ